MQQKNHQITYNIIKKTRSYRYKDLFDKCYNDNKPHGKKDKFYEWWYIDVCTWVFVNMT